MKRKRRRRGPEQLRLSLPAVMATEVREDWSTVRRVLEGARRSLSHVASEVETVDHSFQAVEVDLGAVKRLLNEVNHSLELAQRKSNSYAGLSEDHRRRIGEVDSQLCRLEAWFHSVEEAHPAQKSQPC